MTRPDFDIAICGAGPVGCVLALLLARYSPHPERIALFGQKPPAQGQKLDPRTLALNHGSRQLLEPLGVWPSRAASMHTVHVSQQGRLGRTLITAAELQVNELGSVVNYDDLLSHLRQAVQQHAIRYIEVDQPVYAQSQKNGVYVQAGAQRYEAALAIQSDGTRPKNLKRDYNQCALLATIQSSAPRSAWAFERFTSSGPLALLPHPNQADCYALVWCNSPARTQELLQLSSTAFEKALQTAFGARLGQLQLVSERFVFDLQLSAGPSLPAPYIAAIGNAAQTLHPVAGQGLNLGLRDTAQLALSLRPWLAQTQQDPLRYLHHYAEQRRPDRWLTGSITDFLPRVFATTNPLIQHACGLGLLSMDCLAPARFPLARQLLQGLRV